MRNFFCMNCRISGNAASSKNIHGTVSEQLKKNFAKSRWKVSNFCAKEHDISDALFFQFSLSIYLSSVCMMHVYLSIYLFLNVVHHESHQQHKKQKIFFKWIKIEPNTQISCRRRRSWRLLLESSVQPRRRRCNHLPLFTCTKNYSTSAINYHETVKLHHPLLSNGCSKLITRRASSVRCRGWHWTVEHRPPAVPATNNCYCLKDNWVRPDPQAEPTTDPIIE